MNKLIKPLVQGIAQDLPKRPIPNVGFDEAVSMKQMDLFPLKHGLKMVQMNMQANGLLKKGP